MFAPLVCDVVCSFVMVLSCQAHVSLDVCVIRVGKVAEHSLLGYSASLFAIHIDTSAPRGRTLDGGTIGSLGIKVPRGDSSGEGRAAHGPLHPAMHRSLETLMAPLFVFLLRSWFLSSG